MAVAFRESLPDGENASEVRPTQLTENLMWGVFFKIMV